MGFVEFFVEICGGQLGVDVRLSLIPNITDITNNGVNIDSFLSLAFSTNSLSRSFRLASQIDVGTHPLFELGFI